MGTKHSTLAKTSRIRRISRVVPAAVVGLLLLSGCGSSIGGGGEEASDDALNIGLIVPATGPYSAQGESLQVGFELGVERINAAGGVNGKPVTFEVQDDTGNPATTTQIARKFTLEGGVDLIFGTVTGDTTAAAEAVAREADVPLATAMVGDLCSDWVWGFGTTNLQNLRMQIPFLIETYGPRIAFVGNDYNWPREYADVARGVIADEGGELVAEEYSPLGTTDFESTIGRLAASDPDAILSLVVGPDAIAFTTQASQFGLLTPELGFEGVPLEPDYYGALASFVDGREHASRWVAGLEDPESLEFVAAYQDRIGEDVLVPEVAANAYWGVQFIAAAVESAGAKTGAEIASAIEGFEFDSPLGAGTHFDSSGVSNVFMSDMRIATIGSGGTYAVTETLDPIDAARTSC